MRYTRFLGTILQVTRSGGKHRSRTVSFIPVSAHSFPCVPGWPQPGPVLATSFTLPLPAAPSPSRRIGYFYIKHSVIKMKSLGKANYV